MAYAAIVYYPRIASPMADSWCAMDAAAIRGFWGWAGVVQLATDLSYLERE
jgi:lipopolysaccharide biosynthesis protein